MAPNFRISLLLVPAIFASTSYAQFIERRRTSLGRIIAGCIIGGIFAILFLCLFMMMSRRRRAARTFAMTSGGGPPVNHKPMFGGPWGRSNNEYQGQNGMPMNSYHGQSQNPYAVPNYPSPSNAPYNPEYPNQHTPLPPPAYGKDAEYNNRYSPPQGSPPVNQGTSQQASYMPPPGPPPAAHTTGQDNTFIGGFRN